MRRLASITVAAALALFGLPAVPALAAASGIGPSPVGKPWPLPASPAPRSNLAVLGQAPGPGTAGAVAAAAAVARRTGRSVRVGALTTETTQVSVAPNGTRTVTESVLPVRVRQGQNWVPVNTGLVRGAGELWSAAAVPGDAVGFSPGGSGPAVVLSAAGASLKLWWPGPLPVPVVAGSSATYRGVLPGVDLVLTATSGASGGFREVLVVRSAAAAHDPGLAWLALKASVSNGRLGAVPGGGLAAVLAGRRGEFVAPAPVMWDSSSAPAAGALSAGAVAAARAVGAGLAPMGSGPVSSSAGPAGGARVAPVAAAVSGAGSVLRLVPDGRLLASPSTRFPVFIDPSFSWIPATGSEQAYDPVQSGSGCTGSHYNSSSYPFSPMGYDNFAQGNCQYSDTDYALYRVGIPTVVTAAGAHLNSASVQLTEVYTSSCSANPSVTVSWIGGISSSTGWPGPNRMASNVDSSKAFGPDSGSCNTVQNTGNRVSLGFSIMGDMAAIGTASNITLRVWEPNDTNDVNHKQLTDNPTLQFTYNDTPSVPSNLEEAASSSGTGSIACDSDASDPNLPWIGKTDSTNGPFLLGKFSDPDGDTVAGTVKYWNNASPSTTYTLSAGSSLSGTGSAQIPASFTSAMANGAIVGWQAQATDSVYTSVWSSKCYFAVDPTSPDPPAVTAGFDQTLNQAVDSQVSFTFAQSDTAKEFVWGLDKVPPTTGTIPAGQICSASSTACTLSGGKATLAITVPSPGPHVLWVYQQDIAGNDSGMATGALPGSSSTFTAAADPGVSYTSGASLAANFAAALTAGKSYDSTMISNGSGASCGTATGDGTGTDFVAGDLIAAGWASGKTVTVNGASFTLPSIGSCGVDNLLAAKQTIGAGPSGVQGSALVFLAASSMAFAQVPGQMTGSQDSVYPDPTAPAVMGGTPVTGAGCSGAVALNPTQAGCVPASGTISFAGPGCPSAPQSYDLTVPDWWNGPSDIASVTLPHVVDTSGQKIQTVKIYAFSVPLTGSCAVTSVTLPDVGNTVSAALTPGSAGVSDALPGLHVFAVSVRNTTTATPEAGGAAKSSPSQQGWTGAFESPVEDAFLPPSGVTWGNQTIRLWASPDLTTGQGGQIRIRLSDPGFLSADGTGPLKIGAATIAQQYYGPSPAQAPVPLTFGGSSTVTIPEGGDIYSDPLSLPASWGSNPVQIGKSLLVSLWVMNTSLPDLPMNSWGNGAGAWFSPSSTPNETADTTGTPFTGTGSSMIGATPLLAGIDVTTPAVTLDGVANPGAPTVVVTGNNVVDAFTSQARSDSVNAPSQHLAGQLASQGLTSGFGVTDASIETNQVLAAGSPVGGVSLLARIDRDVLAEPDVGTVVIDQGTEDLLVQGGATSAPGNLNNALTALVTQLNAFGVTVTIGTLTPCSGYSDSAAGHTCTTGTGATVDADRTLLNSMTGAISAPNCAADFDSVVSNGAVPPAAEALTASSDSGDHANLSFAGYAALAPAVLAGPASAWSCPLAPSAFPLPAVP